MFTPKCFGRFWWPSSGSCRIYGKQEVCQEKASTVFLIVVYVWIHKFHLKHNGVMTSKLKTSSVYATIHAFINVIWGNPNSMWIISKCKYKFAAKKSRSVAQWVDQEAEFISNPCPSLIVDCQSWVSFYDDFPKKCLLRYRNRSILNESIVTNKNNDCIFHC